MGKKLTAGSYWEKIFAEYKPNMVSYLEDTGKERKQKLEVQLEKKREANLNNSNNKKQAIQAEEPRRQPACEDTHNVSGIEK